MNELFAKLKKLRGRGLAEWRVRGAQFAALRAEQYGWSRQARVPSDAELRRLLDPTLCAAARGECDGASLLAHFRARTRPVFFAAFQERAATEAALHTRFGVDAAAVVERAQRISAGRFDLLGLSDLDFGAPPDWHLEPVTGKRTPLAHWSRIAYLDPQVAGDKKITWELNRHQHFATLGRAYWHTGDESFAETFVAQLESWLDANPPTRGINWASSLEVALRAIAWLWALHFFRASPRLTPAIFLRTLKFLYLHARHLETYLSTYFSPNTHLTGEALGLFYLGLLLPEFKRAARWRATGERILHAALDHQVRADGVYFEQTTYYQRYTADFYLHFLLLTRANDGRTNALVEQKLSALLDHLLYVTRPDGRTPRFGDDDGGRLMPLDERATDDFRATLATGACLFARPDYKFVAGLASEELLWLCGAAGLERYDQLAAEPPADTSRAFPAGGYYVMRDGWSAQANYMLFDCGPHGTANCGHAHADALSFELAARGRTLLVDPGTYTYTGDAQARDEFRATSAHNAFTVDNASSSVPAGPFAWAHVARAHTRVWHSHKRFDYLRGEHDGFARLDPPLRYARSVLFVKGDYWIVRDRITHASAAHEYALHLHFAPNAAPLVDTQAGPAALCAPANAAAAGLDVFAFGPGGRWHEERGWVSPQYSARVPAPVFRFVVPAATPAAVQDCYTFMLPRAVTAQTAPGAVRVRQLEATGGHLFEITRGSAERADSNDVLLIPQAQYVESGRLTSDFEWAWARFTGDGATLEEFILINGRRFALYGQEIIKTTNRAGFVVARRAGARLVVEVDGRAAGAVEVNPAYSLVSARG